MRVLIAGFCFALLAACSQLPARSSESAAAQTAQPAPAAAPPAEPDAGPELPKQELTRQLLYQFLLGEVAGQRGDLDTASAAYLDLAKKTRDLRVARRATEIAVFARRSEDALEAAALWLELDPAADRARQTLAALLVNTGRLTQAKPHLEKLIADEGANLGQGFLQLNSLLGRHGEKKAVLELTRDLAKPYPNLPEAHLAVAQAALNAEDPDTALAQVRRARELKPEWGLAVLFEAQVVRRSSSDEALEVYRKFLEQNPKSPEVRLAYARLLVAERKYPQARQQFERVMVDHPRNADVAVALGLLAMQLKDYDAASGHFSRALELEYKDQDQVRLFLGQIEEERKRYDRAAAWYQAVERGEHQVQAQVRYAGLLAKQGKLNEARAYLQGLPAETNQHKVQFTLAEAQLLREAGAYRDAFDLLGQALARQPQNPELLYDHAMAAEKVDRIDVLEQNLRALIRIKPDHAHAYNALGYTLADRNQRLDEAQQLIEHALKLSPDDPFILDSMGWVKYRQGKAKEGLEYLKRAYAIRPDPEIAAHLGEVFWMSGERAEAKKVWESALKEHPENKVLVDAIEKFTR